jgi:hypothetical protein
MKSYSKESTVQIQGKKVLYKLVVSVRIFDWSRFLVVKYSACELLWKESFLKNIGDIKIPSVLLYEYLCFVSYSYASLSLFYVYLFVSLTLQSRPRRSKTTNALPSL